MLVVQAATSMEYISFSITVHGRIFLWIPVAHCPPSPFTLHLNTGKSTLADIYLIGKEEDAVNAASKALTNAAISGTVLGCVVLVIGSSCVVGVLLHSDSTRIGWIPTAVILVLVCAGGGCVQVG
jgi:hypothetical protein